MLIVMLLIWFYARSRIAGHFYLSSKPPDLPALPLRTECRTLKHVVASATEAETVGLFHNGQTIIPIRQALQALGHVQSPTPLKTDNSTARDFVNRSLRQKRSKSWDMRYHCYVIAIIACIFEYIGIKDQTMLLTISQNIMLQTIII